MSISKHHNHDYSSGIPLALGDRYYGQDLGRDFHFLRNETGQLLKDLSVNLPVCMSGGIVTQGAGASLNITLGYGYVKFDVTIPDAFAALPPTTTTGALEAVRVSWGALTSFNGASAGCSAYTITDDGATPNYVKVRYKEADGNTRARAKKAGSYSYEKTPFYDFTVNSTAPVAGYELCLAKFTSSGGVYTFLETPYLAHNFRLFGDFTTKAVTASTFAFSKTDRYDRVECDTSSNAITITLPLIADIVGTKLEKITIALVKNDASLDVVTVKCHATDGSKLSCDALAELYLTKVGDYLSLQYSATSGYWEVVSERLTAQLRLNTYAGFGSTDTAIMRFTNVRENIGSSGSTVADKGCFQENHTTGYHVTAETGAANAGGLEITINKSGKYTFHMSIDTYNTSQQSGFSLNSNQLTTGICDITIGDRLAFSLGYNGATNTQQSTSWTGYLKKGDIVRCHCGGVPATNEEIFSCAYIG